ncbi:hypothetical protein ACIGD1_34330 [Streptomyces sp. NPDC085612]|uniref:hypothetical protein n=1 Tax=Streptomyces sp. NPDC085612 TaxID=3365732 RepID=UPI0037D80BBF
MPHRTPAHIRLVTIGALLTATLIPTTTATAETDAETGKILRSDLEVVRIDPDPAVPGGTTTVYAHVVNLGPDTTTAPFTVTVHLPPDATAEGPFFPDTCRVTLLSRGSNVRCTFPRGLGSNRTASAEVPIRLSPDTPLGNLNGGYVQVTAPIDDPNPNNNRQPFTIPVD